MIGLILFVETLSYLMAFFICGYSTQTTFLRSYLPENVRYFTRTFWITDLQMAHDACSGRPHVISGNMMIQSERKTCWVCFVERDKSRDELYSSRGMLPPNQSLLDLILMKTPQLPASVLTPSHLGMTQNGTKDSQSWPVFVFFYS